MEKENKSLLYATTVVMMNCRDDKNPSEKEKKNTFDGDKIILSTWQMFLSMKHGHRHRNWTQHRH